MKSFVTLTIEITDCKNVCGKLLKTTKSIIKTVYRKTIMFIAPST